MTSITANAPREDERVTQDDLATKRGRIQEAVDYCRSTGGVGCTWAEYAHHVGLHHGAASSALSMAHKMGRVTRLAERRNGSGVYVTPEFVAGRTEVPHRGRARRLEREQLIGIVETWLDGPATDGSEVLVERILEAQRSA